MNGARLASVLSIFVLAAGCVSSIEPRSAGATGFDLGRGDARAAPSTEHEDEWLPCVMEVPGTAISVSDIEGGVVIVFDTLARESVGDLRRAVRGLIGVLSTGRSSVRHDHSSRAVALARRYRGLIGELPPLTAAMVEVQGGARLEVRATRALDVGALRTKMRQEVGVMQRGVSPLLDGRD